VRPRAGVVNLYELQATQCLAEFDSSASNGLEQSQALQVNREISGFIHSTLALRIFTTSLSWTYLNEYSDKEPENTKDIVVWGESVSDAHDNHRPLTDQKDRLTTELV